MAEDATVEIGVGLDARLGLTYAESRDLARQAVALGYSSAWTPSQVTSRDAFHVCVQWSQAAGPGLGTAISVVPAPLWTPTSLASQAATTGELTEGRFILGIGPGGVYRGSALRRYGLSPQPVIAQMRDYLTVLRGLLAGETVDYAGKTLQVRGVKLGFTPPRVPVYLAALGPQMVRLAGELADGVMPNWSSAEQIAWCRERLAEGAARVGRDPSDVKVSQYIRVCVDEDVAAARRAFGAQVLGYALNDPADVPPGGEEAARTAGYRGHFGRMGFESTLREVEAMRDGGASEAELIDALPDELLLKVGYFGPPAGAAAAFRRLAEGLDTAIVRIITTRRDPARVALAMEACRPALVQAA